jgi:hypothetical protein
MRRGVRKAECRGRDDGMAHLRVCAARTKAGASAPMPSERRLQNKTAAQYAQWPVRSRSSLAISASSKVGTDWLISE